MFYYFVNTNQLTYFKLHRKYNTYYSSLCKLKSCLQKYRETQGQDQKKSEYGSMGLSISVIGNQESRTEKGLSYVAVSICEEKTQQSLRKAMLSLAPNFMI